MRRTKIVVTLGPATSSPEMIRKLIEEGMDVARINFSHGVQAEHARVIAAVRSQAESLGKSVAILQDLQGPKIRTGALAAHQPVVLEEGQPFRITTQPLEGDARRVSTTYTALPHDLRAGDRVLLSDGRIELRVQSVSESDVLTEVVHGGHLAEHQGINLPGVAVSAPALSDKDLDDLRFGLEQGVDYIGLSFVRQPEDVRIAKEAIARHGQATPVIVKLEKPEALDALDDILKLADGVMVARGDLGVEMPVEQVPIAQKRIIAAANRAALPVITATQMLESMISSPRPTRAEVSDVANAVMDGSDAVMLSGETAVGEFPLEAVQMMHQICTTVDEAKDRAPHPDIRLSGSWAFSEVESLPEAIGEAVCAIVDALPAHAIWVFTRSGNTARMVSHFRPRVPILAFTPDAETYRRLPLLWGVEPLAISLYHNDAEYFQQIQNLVATRGLAQQGDIIILTGGHPMGQRGPTNFIKIMQLGKEQLA